MNKEVKLCVNCRWFHQGWELPQHGFCNHPEVRDNVTGKGMQFPEIVRKYHCGNDPKWFSAKPKRKKKSFFKLFFGWIK